MHSSSIRFEDILDNCIFAIQVQGKTVADCLALYPAQREELEPLLRLTIRLQAARTLKAPPEFRQVAVARMRNLVAARPPRGKQTATRPNPLHHLQPRIQSILEAPRKLPVTIMVSIVVAIWVLIGTGTVYASTNALPGDLLYPMKQTIETVQLALSLDDANVARLRLTFASRRLDEVATLLARDRPQDIAQAVTDYKAQVEYMLASFGADSSLSPEQQADFANLLVAEMDRQEVQLTILRDQSPEVVRPVIESALMSSRTGRDQALEVVGEESDEGIPEPPTSTPSPVPPTPTPTPTPIPTPSPEPPTPTPSPEPPTPTPSPEPPTLAPSPLPPTRTPNVNTHITDLVKKPTFTPSPEPPTPPPLPTPSEWPIPPEWPSGCPPPSEWPPSEWPSECPPPSEWPPEWPIPPEWPSEWPIPPEWPSEWPTPPAWPPDWPQPPEEPGSPEIPDMPDWSEPPEMPDMPDWSEPPEMPELPSFP